MKISSCVILSEWTWGWKCCRRFSSLPACLEPVAWPCWSLRVVCCETSSCTRGKVALSIGISNNSHSRLWHFVDGQHPPLFFRSLCSASLSLCQDRMRPVNTRTRFGSRWASHWPFLLSDKMRLSFCPKHKKKQKSRLQTLKRQPQSRARVTCSASLLTTGNAIRVGKKPTDKVQ